MENGTGRDLRPILHSPLSIFALGQQSKYLARLRMPVRLGLLEDGFPIAMHLEATAARRDEPDVRRWVLATNLGRQTDGSRFIVSKRAILDRDRHGTVIGRAVFEITKANVARSASRRVRPFAK
jgi:hypothetical protein